MNYLREDILEEEFRSGLMDAAIGLSVIFPLLATFLIPRNQHVNPDYLYVIAGCFGVVIIYVAIKLHSVIRRGSVILPPMVTFVLVTCIGVSIALLNAAAGGPTSVFRVGWVLLDLFVAIIGNRSMQRWFWLTLIIGFGWSIWENGERSGLWAASMMVMGSVLYVLPMMIRVPVLGLISVQRSRRSLDQLTNIALRCETFDEGMALCLPLVTTVMPVSRAVMFVRTRGAGEFQVLEAWPGSLAEDLETPTRASFADALSEGVNTFDDEKVIIPIGDTYLGNLMVALDLEEKISPEQRFTLTREMCGALAASFLRLANHIATLSTLKVLSRTDPLTGLANRRMLEERSQIEISQAREAGRMLSVAMIDIDFFKNYNDTFGHLAGDILLRELSDTMAPRIRKSDFIARYGGEEFCIILPDTDLQGAFSLVDSLRERIHLVNSNCPVSISGGVASWNGSEDFESLLKRADHALYEAKGSGRDKIRCGSVIERAPTITNGDRS